MGGRIEATSREGEGSTFRFTARFAKGDPEKALRSLEKQVALEQQKPDRALRVLVVDDAPLNQELVKSFLELEGHRVETADNGEEACERLRDEVFDAVLMDIQMPRMDGLEATKAIRACEGWAVESDVPIIGLTAHASRRDQRKVMKAGMDDYVVKPVDLDALLAALARATGATASGQPSPPPDDAASAEAPAPPDEVLENTECLALLGNSQDLLNRMRAVFLRDNPGDMQALSESLDAGETAQTVLFAHRIKGTASTIGAKPAAEAAKRLEFAGRNEQTDLLPTLFGQLETEVSKVEEALDELGITAA
jgi:CheY-like chemotaxis protein/HPt (histidine-containing phosphotransfer) domain-containing protein